MSELPNSVACERNKKPILEVLHQEFADRRSVLEIGSGTGQHAVYFARGLPHLVWQTSDLPDNHPGITAWLGHADLPNAREPLVLDVENVEHGALSGMRFDAVFSANTAHIMRVEAVVAMFRLAGSLLPAGGLFCLYGPFNFDGEFSSESNAEFDVALRHRDRTMGIRDIRELDDFARQAGLRRVRLYAMPANNHLAVWSTNEDAEWGSERNAGDLAAGAA
jgi:cyclopropane fatty-acyl-phospholipid synthase-like methyltransferase